jgi:hypothetical protein
VLRLATAVATVVLAASLQTAAAATFHPTPGHYTGEARGGHRVSFQVNPEHSHVTDFNFRGIHLFGSTGLHKHAGRVWRFAFSDDRWFAEAWWDSAGAVHGIVCHRVRPDACSEAHNRTPYTAFVGP